ncbi:MAG: HAD family hydrolase [Acutalibacteraceae bacterium]|jgi:Cof subfamily protein (haloacid dehalogenase superfamily)
MNRKYIFLDVDGTLVDFDGRLPLSAETALRTAQQNGHRLILCTGRQKSQIYPWLLQKIPFDGVISSSGANVEYNGKCVARHLFPKDRLENLLCFFRRENIPFCLQTAESLYAEPWCAEGIFSYFQQNGVDPDKMVSLFGDLTPVACADTLTNVEKVVYYNAGEDVAIMRRRVGADYQIAGYSFGNLGAVNGEVSLSTVNKAKGLEACLKHCGADVRDSVAVGDGDNDMDMIRFAGIGIAMGNATPELKRAADCVTDSIDCDGLQKAFFSVGLI